MIPLYSMNTFHSEYAIEGLKAIGKSVDPKVKVVYLTRNPLDRKVSNLRHDLSKQAKEDLPAHCEAGDVECNKRFSDVANSGVKLPTGKELIHWLNMDSSQDDDIKASLEEAAVDYVHVSYEKLYGSDDADEWMKIFRFLGVGPMEDLTIEDVRASFNLVSTHSKGRNLTISNFIEVETTLKGTKYEHLLFD
jgi:formylmethanofuran dehydrogenase subunit E-like metal-binding protein